ncbi:MAG: DMT family transporter [Desulfosarcinaceae bacterium]|nr:DMT family transporter [Desulfosarcinaceae bacterium]
MPLQRPPAALSCDPAPPRASGDRLPVAAGLLLGLLCFLWGANAVSIKFSNQGVPPLMAAAIRSLIAGGLVWAYARRKGHRVVFPPGTQIHALVIGALFGLEFLFLYWGLAFTPASRAMIFLYTHPFWVALGAHLLIPGDRLRLTQVMGLILAFGGILAVFGARSPALPPRYWLGDLMELAAALFWAANTLYVKRITVTVKLDHYQSLFAQLIYGFPVLAIGSLIFEMPSPVHLTATVVAALLYQSVVVAFASYLAWFWLICRHPVSRLAAFTFMAPLFAVILGGWILQEPVTALIWVGLGCVALGVYGVNR